MKKREKVLVGAMAVAIILGLTHYLASKSSPGNGVDDPKQANTLASQFVTEHRQKLLKARPGPDVQKAEAGIVSTWSSNPFTKRDAIEKAPKAEIQEFVYTGFLNLEGKTLALINGRPYQTNDLLPESPYRVLSITSSQVVLTVQDGDRTVTVNLNRETKGEEQQ